MINSFCRLAHRGGHHRGCALSFPSRISSRLYSLQVSALSSSKSRRSWRSTSDVVVNSRGRIDAPILTRSSNQSSQRVFFDWLEKNLGVVRPDDWYNIRTRQVIAAGGAVLLVHIFKGSISTMVQRMRPDHVWYPWLWRTRPKSGSASADPTTIRSFLSWVQQRSSTESSLQFWYSVSSEWLRLQKGGVWFFRNTPSHASLSDVLKRVFPEHAWNDELFQAGTNDSPVLLAPVIIQRLAQRLQVDELSMWYSVDPKRANMTTEERRLLRAFKGSLASVLQACYPNHEWQPWKFQKAPSRFWKSTANQRAYLIWLAKTLNIASPADWYTITGLDLVKNHGGSLWKAYKGSVVDCLRAGFPEHNFEPWRFSKSQSRLWGDAATRKCFLDYFAHELRIARPEDWMGVTQKQIFAFGGQKLLEQFDDSLELALRDSYPTENWNDVFRPRES